MEASGQLGHPPPLNYAVVNSVYSSVYTFLLCGRERYGLEIIIVIAFQKETDVELGSLLRSEALSVYNQLLLYLSVSYDKVFSGLAMLALKDDTYTGPKDLKTTQHLVSCYKRNFCSCEKKA